jgi:large subunit ribosomal protein L30
MKKLRITYKKSMIGYSQDQRDTMKALGLSKLHQVTTRPDNPSVRGMVFKVRHLVQVEEIDEGEQHETA